MFNLICKIRLHGRRFHSLPSKFSLLQLNQFSANAPKTTSKNPNQNSFPAIYLENTHGFSPERALTYSKYLRFDSPEKPDSVIAFFKRHHFTDAQISLLVRKWPLVFRYAPDLCFGPKIEFLISSGFSSSDIARVLRLQPDVLSRSLEGQIIPCVNFLRSFLCHDKDVVYSISRCPNIIRENLRKTSLPNIEILRGVGVADPHIAALLKFQPRAIILNPERFRATVEEVQKLGLNPRRSNFITALIVMRGLNKSVWKEKIDVFTRRGWSEHQVMDAFRRFPRLMEVSTNKITRVMDLFASRMCLNTLFKAPEIISLSSEKTIRPRIALYHVLSSKGLIKQGRGLRQLLRCPKSLFFEKYVRPFVEEAREVLELYPDELSSIKK